MKNDHAVSDLGLASALASLGYNIVALERSTDNPRRMIFHFEGEQGLSENVAAYWTGELKVSALHLFTQQKLLKQRLYASHD